MRWAERMRPEQGYFAQLVDRVGTERGNDALWRQLAVAVTDLVNPGNTMTPATGWTNPPRYSGNRAMLARSELIRTPGMTSEAWAALGTYVTAYLGLIPGQASPKIAAPVLS